jgi:hypothetical protein
MLQTLIVTRGHIKRLSILRIFIFIVHSFDETKGGVLTGVGIEAGSVTYGDVVAQVFIVACLGWRGV